MKKGYIIGALAFTALLMSGCSDDKKESLPVLDSKTYYGKALNLNYSDGPAPGKMVTVTPNGSNSRTGELKATLNLYSMIDYDQLEGLGMSGMVQGPGVIPGEKSTDLDVTLIPGDGCYTFSGSDATDEVSFTYNGEIRDDLLTLNIIEPKLKDLSLAGTVWAPAPLKRDELLQITSSPFSIAWEMNGINDLTLDPGLVLNLISTLPFIPVYNNTAYTSPAELFTQMFKAFAFRGDGNIIATYISTSQGAAQYMTLQPNTLQYVVDSSDELEMFVNPVSVYGLYLVNQKAGIGANDLTFLKTLITTTVPLLADGLDMNYSISDLGEYKLMKLTTETEESVKMLSTFMLNLSQNPEFMAKLSAIIDSTPNLKPYADDIKFVISQLPVLIQNTTKLEIGLNLLAGKS